MQESILQYAEHHESVLLGEQYVMWFLFQGLIIFAVPRYAWRRAAGLQRAIRLPHRTELQPARRRREERRRRHAAIAFASAVRRREFKN